MTVTVKHSKVSSIPDSADTSLVRPSDWNADHTLTGLGTAAELNAGVANGVATLDAGGTVPLSQIPASIQGGVSYQGTWNATTNTPTLTSSVGTKGYYYVVSVAGSTNLNGVTNWNVGDWAIFNGSAWEKVDNTDAVTSVNGYTGTVVLTQSDIGGTVAIANGGTGQTTANAAFNALAPSQTGNTGKYLTTDGTNTSWATNSGGDVTGPSSATDNALARFDGTTGKLIQNSVVVVNDAGSMSGVESIVLDGSVPAVTSTPGTMWYDSSTETLNFQQNNITQQVGEEILLYGKASAAINDSPLQIIYQTGVVGASGVITFAPTVAGITDANLILGCATEPLSTNQFGRITTYGTVHNITTNGTAYGETWADGDVIWYNPVTGNPTKTKPSAPGIKVQLGIVTHAGSGGSGSFQVLLRPGSELGGTDSNVGFGTLANNNLIQYSTSLGYWTNVAPSSVTGVGSVANSVTFTNTGGAASGTTFNGSAARTIDYSTVGAPKADGTGASGTWAISVSGNAATVTNGVYTTGSYADPTWITSLDGSKITNSIDGGTF
jgi:hypothetical protein